MKNLWYNILLPFKDLSIQARILQVIRLVTCFATIAFIIASLVSSLFSSDVYMARVNCAHLDVSSGLYKSLRNSVSLSSSILGNSDSAFPIDSSLTNSEIAILTDYAESQVANAPQYIVTSLWSWCYGNYNITQFTDKHGIVHTRKHNDVVTCTKMQKGYVFDYRNELETVGLQSILAYAYQTTKYDDQTYDVTVSKRHSRYKLVPSGLIFTGCSQFVVLLFGYILYSNRGPEKDLSKIPAFLLNIIALISVASFLAVCISCGILVGLLTEIRSEIKQNLAEYGISLSLGGIWFLLLWLSFVFALFSALSWTFPLWCANPPDDFEEDEFEDTGYRSDNSFINDSGTPVLRKNKKGEKRMRNIGKFMRNRSKGIRFTSSNDVYDNNQRDTSDDDDDAYFAPVNAKNISKYERDEDELRKLGETLSRKTSVRRIRGKLSKKSRPSNLHPLDEQYAIPEESRDLLYHDVNMHNSQYPMTDSMAHHYREQTYDGYTNRHEPTANSMETSLGTSKDLTNTTRGKRQNSNTFNQDKSITNNNKNKRYRNPSEINFRTDSLQARHFQHDTKNNPFLLADQYESLQKKRDSSESYLDNDEIEFLDNNNYINRL